MYYLKLHEKPTKKDENMIKYIMQNMKYNASSINVLEGLKAIRSRPGMYVGDLSEAFRHLIKEVLDNSVDEFRMGFCKNIYINMQQNVCSIEDDARGIPAETYLDTGKSTLEVILTTLHSGGKFNTQSYQYSAGTHGIGLCAVTALSDFMEVEVYRNQEIYYIKTEKGEVVVPTHIVGSTNKNGTKITFSPDFSIVQENEVSLKDLMKILEEVALLNPGLKIHLKYNEEEKLIQSEGIKSSVSPKIFHKVIYINEPRLNCAFGFSTSFTEDIMCFTNNVKQSEGGTHLTGFKAALTKSVKNYIDNNLNSKIIVQGEDVHHCVVGILSVNIQDPQFASQTKAKLVSREAKSLVENCVFNFFEKWLEENPSEAISICKYIISIADRREAMLRTKETLKKLDENPTFLAGKLIDCRSENPEERELFILEGDSAGGSAASSRDGTTQAILPIKGKIINVFRHHNNKVLENVEIRSLISAVGTGILSDFNYEKLRYHKIIIMTDADQDGNHIRTLLLTFFMNFMPELFLKGHIYYACPPLFKVSADKKQQYIQDNQSLDKFLGERLIRKYDLQMSFETLVSYLQQCRVFNNKLLSVQSPGILNKHILSLAYTYDVFEKPLEFKHICEKVFGWNCSVEKVLDYIHCHIKSTFENVTYIIPKENISTSIVFPIKFGEKIIYEPLEFLEEVSKKMNEGVEIQRYKGLGEMNPEELFETTIDPSKRVLKKLFIKAEEFDTVRQIFLDIMNDENNRREFVLNELPILVRKLSVLSD